VVRAKATAIRDASAGGEENPRIVGRHEGSLTRAPE
jgi:hypothetical protein